MPDDELFKISLDGKLRTSDTLRKNVRRMLKDNRASELVTNFVGQWLQLRNLQDVSIDEKKFWRFKPELLSAMKKETELFTWDIVQRDASILEFLNADFTFVNKSLSRHYGLSRDERPETDDEFKRVSLTGTKRGGLLTQGSILVITSNPTQDIAGKTRALGAGELIEHATTTAGTECHGAGRPIGANWNAT